MVYSVIIPTYNRVDKLSKCLSGLSKQDYYQSNFEVIVVNDGGVSLEEVIKKFKESLDINLIEQSNTGPAQARNRGATAAKGAFLVFIDDDCYPAKDFLQKIDRHCQENPQSSIGGQTINELSDNIYATTSQLIVDVVYQYYNPQPEQAHFFASNNMIFPRQQFLEIGGFHPHFRTSEDREICDRWLRSGYQMTYARDIKVYHAHDLDFFSFWQQHLSYGRGAFYYHNIRAQRGAEPFRPDFSFHQRLVIYSFQVLPIHQAIFVALLMFWSQVASAVGYFQEKWRPSLTSQQLERKFVPLDVPQLIQEPIN